MSQTLPTPKNIYVDVSERSAATCYTENSVSLGREIPLGIHLKLRATKRGSFTHLLLSLNGHLLPIRVPFTDRVRSVRDDASFF